MTNDEYSISIGGDVSGQVAAGKEVHQGQGKVEEPEVRTPLRILFLAANPRETSQLRLGEEVRTIDERLRAAEFGDRIELAQHWAVRISDLSEALLRSRPHLVHFSGHGSAVGSIILEDESGNAVEVEPGALGNLFGTVGENLRCVVLNACYSATQASSITKDVDCVVGTSKAIGDKAAIRFAGGFYTAVGYGETLQTAFELGRNEIDLAGLGEEETPRLLHRENFDPSQVRLIKANA